MSGIQRDGSFKSEESLTSLASEDFYLFRKAWIDQVEQPGHGVSASQYWRAWADLQPRDIHAHWDVFVRTFRWEKNWGVLGDNPWKKCRWKWKKRRRTIINTTIGLRLRLRDAS